AVLGGFEDVAAADRGDAGVVDEYVETTEPGQHFVHQALAVGSDADVGATQKRVAVVAQKSLSFAGSLVVAGEIDCAAMAAAGQSPEKAAADAAAAAGDQSNRGGVHRVVIPPRFQPVCLAANLRRARSPRSPEARG